MRTRLTLCAAGGYSRDFEIRAPMGSTLAEVQPELARAMADSPTGRHLEQARSANDEVATVWSGARALPSAAIVGGPGLRTGSVLGIGQPGDREPGVGAVLQLHVVSGPDAGLVYPVPRGLITIGRDRECDVTLTDCDISRRHLQITVSANGLSLRDLDSSNGTQLLPTDGADRIDIDADGAELPLNGLIALGETRLCITSATVPAAATGLGEDGRLLVNRPPRLTAQLPDRAVRFPEPGKRTMPGLPWLAALLPAVGGAAFAWFMKNPQFLAFALLSPIFMLATSLGERISGRGSRRRERVRLRALTAQRAKQLRELIAAETDFRRRVHPDPAALLHIACTPDARIWERRRDDPDFLDVRIGLADLPATVTIYRGNEPRPAPTLPCVPLSFDLRRGALGICGPRPLTLGLTRWALAQAAALHSPADLRMYALLGDDGATAWRWLRWLPHLRGSSVATDAATNIARTGEERAALVAHLLAEIDQRHGSAGTGRTSWSGPWSLVFLDQAATHADLTGLTRVLTEGPALGVTAICLDTEVRRLPPGCVGVVRITGETGTRVRLSVRATPTPRAMPPGVVATTGEMAEALADRVSLRWAERVARSLAPLADPGAEDSAALPTSVRLLDLLGLQDPSGIGARAFIERWQVSDRRARCVVGIGPEGPVDIDLDRDGPHALIAGTTGAGKSELLQTLVAGLAVNCAPASLQFVLIDYKGGAAFGDCARLPHTAGLVTDLDTHLTRRALQSLDAELRRRETCFADAAASDLPAYQRTAQARTHPVARLVLVVDEFAALAEELPEFVTGLVGIAQRGRSLGVHLILATQRPGGVVSPEIRANTALRIALRVIDPGESSDVIATNDAAAIDKHTPGRAYLRTGAVLTQFQTGRIGAALAPDGAVVQVSPLDPWGNLLPARPSDRRSERTDLAVLVDALISAADLGGTPSVRRPWLEPLPDVIVAQEIDVAQDIEPRPSSATRVTIGLLDRPEHQDQGPFVVDLAIGSSVLITGGARSGRTTCLRTLVTRAADQLDADQLFVYALDCAGAGLRPLADLPHCGAVVSRDAPSSIERVLSRLNAEVGRRNAVLAELGSGSAADANAAGHRLPPILLVLDGWEGFLACTEDIDGGRPVDTLLQLMRDGAAAGLTVVITGDRATLSTRVAGAATQRLILRLSDPNDYAIAGLARRVVPARMPPGRAVDAATGHEIQLAVLAFDCATATQLAVLASVIEKARTRVATLPAGPRPFVVRALPSRVGRQELARNRCPRGVVLLGVGGDDAAPIRLDLRPGTAPPRFLVAGPARSGRSSVLLLVATQLADQSVRFVVAGSPRGPLREQAQTRGWLVIDPQDSPAWIATRFASSTDAAESPSVLLVDDSEIFAETAAGEVMAELIRAPSSAVAVVLSGRTDDLAMTFRGVSAEVKRSRSGLLLQPGPGDGDLLGLRLPYLRTHAPPGRGLVTTHDVTCGRPADDTDSSGPSESSDPVAIQVALP